MFGQMEVDQRLTENLKIEVTTVSIAPDVLTMPLLSSTLTITLDPLTETLIHGANSSESTK